MLRKALTVAMALLVVGLLAVNSWASEDEGALDKKVEELTQVVHQLEGMVKDLAFQVQQTQAIGGVVKELSFDLKKSQSDVKDLEKMSEEFKALKPQVLNLEGTLRGFTVEFKEKLGVVQSRVFDLETTVQGLDVRLKSVEGKVRELLALESRLAQLQKRVESMGQRLDELSQVPTGPQGILELTERIEGLRLELSAKIGELVTRVKALEGRVGGLPIGALKARIDQNSSRIASLEATAVSSQEVDALQEQLSSELEALKAQTDTNLVVAAVGLVAGLAALATLFGLF